MQRFSNAMVRAIERWLPEPFAFAILMTFLTIALVLAITPSTPSEILEAWGDGLSALLAFTAQMALMMLFAYALAHIGPVPRLLERLASLPSSPRAAYLSAVLFTGLVSLLNWPLGLILGALYARELGRSAHHRNVPVHYPLLVGANFAGFVVWHMGYSASAPLFVATDGNAMQEQLGGLIPVTDTIFTSWNILIAAITLAVVAVVAVLLHPRDPAAIQPCELPRASERMQASHTHTPSGAERLEHSRIPTLMIGLLITAYAVNWFATRGLQLDLNIVNWTFLGLGLLLARSTSEYTTALYSGGRAVAPVLLQYPFYGGIMGLMLGTGVVTSIAPLFARIATENTLPVVAFLFGGLINFFIPSGGAQWAVQGPAFIAAAETLGTELPLIVMGIAYGDQWTNIIHPFTVIPVVILTGLKARQIIAYSAVMFVAAGIPLGVGLYLSAALAQ